MGRNEDENPGYYAVIPAEVRYDQRLSQSAKLFYGEVSALTDMKGYCWAGNAYFCRLYNVQERQIRRWIAELETAGHVRVQLTDGGTKRMIWIANRLIEDGLQKTAPGRSKKTAPPDEKDRHNSTTNNETLTLSGDDQPATDKRRPGNEEAVVAYCVSIGLTADDGVYYWSKWQGNGYKNAGHAILDWRQTIRSAKAGGYAPSQRRGTRRYETTTSGRPEANRARDREHHAPGRGGGEEGGIPNL